MTSNEDIKYGHFREPGMFEHLRKPFDSSQTQCIRQPLTPLVRSVFESKWNNRPFGIQCLIHPDPPKKVITLTWDHFPRAPPVAPPKRRYDYPPNASKRTHPSSTGALGFGLLWVESRWHKSPKFGGLMWFILPRARAF